MPLATLNGIRLNYDVTGTGPLVVMVMGSGSPGRVWKTYQVPALVKAGFRVATYDSRGIAPSDECATGIRMADLVGDAAALIEHLGAPAHVVGHSMGARVTLELALARPELVDRTVTMGAAGRLHPLAAALNGGEQALYDKDVQLPPQYAAAVKAMLNLSPASVEDPAKAQEWLDIFEFTSGAKAAPGVRAQLGMDRSEDRRAAYTRITKPSLVIGFADDRMTPATLGREVAQAIPGAHYTELEKCGHFGYLEQPDAVNEAIVGFLTATA